MLLPILAVLIAPVLAVVSRALQIVPAAVLVLSEIIAPLLAVLLALVPRIVAAVDPLIPVFIPVLGSLAPVLPLFRALCLAITTLTDTTTLTETSSFAEATTPADCTGCDPTPDTGGSTNTEEISDIAASGTVCSRTVPDT